MENDTKILKDTPTTPGVYLLKDEKGRVLYVGKAKNLAHRLRYYFGPSQPVEPKIHELTKIVASFDTIPTVSEFDAFILEAKLIRQYQPKYNSVRKDDKSPLFLVLTLSEPLPRVIFARKTQLKLVASKRRDRVFGPFQSGRILRSVMRDIRHTIPYCRDRVRRGKPCFYTHLGLCNPCPSYLAKAPNTAQNHALVKKYRANMRRLADVLDGRSFLVLNQMEAEMMRLAAAHLFEEAATVRNQIRAFHGLLEHHWDPSVYVESPKIVEELYKKELGELHELLSKYFDRLTLLRRIECIDISHTTGTYAVGSLVVLTDGKPDTSWYRRFRIRPRSGANDVSMIEEVVSRRVQHTDWPFPSLLLVDGGKGQIRAARDALTRAGVRLPVVGLAKRQEEIIVPVGTGFRSLRLPISSPALQVLTRIRDEAHRFALRYHRLLRNYAFLPGKLHRV